MENDTRQCTLTFHFGNEEFKVILEDSAPSKAFFDYLKKCHLINKDEEFENWFYSITENTWIKGSGSNTSLKVRKKASLLGLSTIYGKIFTENREESYRRSKEKFYV